MTEATKDFYLANFAQFEREVAKNGQAWTQPLRKAAIARFAELGFPTTQDRGMEVYERGADHQNPVSARQAHGA